MIAFSYSRLNAFANCPKRFYNVAISKSVKEPPSEHTSFGTTVHKALQRRVEYGKELPDYLAKYESLFKQLDNSAGKKLVELQLAIDKDLNPTDWFASNVYCRAILDLLVENNSTRKATILDWKTGKVTDDFSQLLLSTAIYFAHSPEINEVIAGYVFIKHNVITKEKIHRNQLPHIWNKFLPQIKRYQEAFEKDEFPPRQGWLCKTCPVSKCKFNEAK